MGVLAGIAFKLLKCFRADSLEICNESGTQYDPSAPDEFRQLCSAVLKCCNSLMVRTVPYASYRTCRTARVFLTHPYKSVHFNARTVLTRIPFCRLTSSQHWLLLT